MIRGAGLLLVLSLLVGAAPASGAARVAVTRTAPYDFGCTHTWMCTTAPWEPARQGLLTQSAYAGVFFAFFVVPIPVAYLGSTVAGIEVRVDRHSSFDVSVRLRQASAQVGLAGPRNGDLCLVLTGTSIVSGCLPLPAPGETVVRMPPQPVAPGLYRLHLWIQGAGSGVLDRIHYVISPT